MDAKQFNLWRSLSRAPYHFPMDAQTWEASMFHDHDSDGRPLFLELHTSTQDHGMIQYGYTAFGFDQAGGISAEVHYPVIRFLAFEDIRVGQQLLDIAMNYFGSGQRIHAFFHCFGMSACGRHGKLHESDAHVQRLLLGNGFIVEHENVYYSCVLNGEELASDSIELLWKDPNAGECREFAAVSDGCEIGWGQVHFLPQGDIAYLRWIYIDGTRQNRGHGTAVMQSLLSALFEMGIRRFDTDTALDNAVAQHYYEKNGFIREGITRSFYTK